MLFFIYALSLIVPFLFLLNNSFKEPAEYVTDILNGDIYSLPETFIWRNYIDVFSEMKTPDTYGNDITFLQMTFNSVWYTAVIVIGGLAASTMVAYCLSKYKFKIRGVLYGIAIVSMTIPIIGTTGAMYELTFDLNIYNTPLYPNGLCASKYEKMQEKRMFEGQGAMIKSEVESLKEQAKAYLGEKVILSGMIREI